MTGIPQQGIATQLNEVRKADRIKGPLPETW